MLSVLKSRCVNTAAGVSGNEIQLPLFVSITKPLRVYIKVSLMNLFETMY